MSPNNTTAEDYARQVTPLSCEREPIHIVNRIQPCGTLLVVDSELTVVQCSTNAVDMLPEDFIQTILLQQENNDAADNVKVDDDSGGNAEEKGAESEKEGD